MLHPVYYLSIICLLLYSTCRPPAVSDDYIPHYTSNQILQILDSVSKDSSALYAFCQSWNQIKPAKPDFINQNDTIAAVFAVYEAYKSQRPTLMSRRSWCYVLDRTNHFLCIERNLKYAILPQFDSMLYDIPHHLDTLKNFRPPMVSITNRKLYMLPEYAEALNAFLGVNDPVLKNKTMIYSEDTLTYHRFIRYEHRRAAVGKVVALRVMPRISCILFSPDLHRARVHLDDHGHGAAALFNKTNGVWTFVEQKATWVE